MLGHTVHVECMAYNILLIEYYFCISHVEVLFYLDIPLPFFFYISILKLTSENGTWPCYFFTHVNGWYWTVSYYVAIINKCELLEETEV
jgi:hypothetical protein